MSRTERKNYRHEEIRDGEHAKRCLFYKCEYCRKIWYRELLRKLGKKELKNWRDKL